MKLDYDIESNILEDIHDLDSKECLIISDSDESENYYKTTKIITDILDEGYLNIWKDNSGSSSPPDFINERDSLMMEVMRFDDHSPDGKINPNLAKQRQMKKTLESLAKLPKVNRMFMIGATDLPTELDHNYKYFYTGFQRTIRKHLAKINKYRSYHPNKKIIFLVLNEASGIYFESVNKSGESGFGRIHYIYADKRFVNEFINSDLDYLILFSPYNHFDSFPKKEEPNLVIFDVKNFMKNKEYILLDYDETRMVSSEK